MVVSVRKITPVTFVIHILALSILVKTASH
jgi:hypothetical protein